MYISELKTYNFRNLKYQTISFRNGVNLIVGKNGQGKTNVLEAINILSTVKSFRSSKLNEAIAWNQHEASVFTKVVSKTESEINLGIAFDKRSKKAFINDQQIKAADEYIGKLVCVTFTPDDLELVKGGPSERRRFLDKSLAFLNPKYIRTLSSYNTALKSKNAILRNLTGSRRSDLIDQLDSWNRILAKHGAEILKDRKVFVTNLSNRAKNLYNTFSPSEESLGLLLKSAKNNLEPSEYLLLEEMTEVRERELAQGQALVGPHRDDLIITLNGSDSRSFASQGQTRSIVLALKLALIEEIQSVRGESPVILLDDVDSELDQNRRDLFFNSILSHGCQVIITATNAKEIPLAKEMIHQLRMEQGMIT